MTSVSTVGPILVAFIILAALTMYANPDWFW